MLFRVLFLFLFFNSIAMAEKPQSIKLNPNSLDKNEKIFEDMVLLLVDKNKLTARLVTWPQDYNKSKLLGEFKIAIGKEKGDKKESGDNKTPEGIYITKKIIDKENLPAKYGPKAIPINYPNPMDRVERKTGSGIWLHGVINDERVEKANVTEGCIAFYNKDIVRLTRWLNPNQGIVIISNNLDNVNKLDDLNLLQEETNKWVADWSSRNIDAYMSHYSKNFRYNGMNFDQYKKYKLRIFNSYKKIILKTNNIRVISHYKYAVSLMNQDFFGDQRFTSKGRKFLYWIKEDGTWKIRREIFENERVKLTRYGKEELSMLSKNIKNHPLINNKT